MSNIRNLSGKRYYELDGLRGLAALVVFFGHARYMLDLYTPFSRFIENTVLPIFWDGSASVVLFFVLSGFVLTLPYVGISNKPVDFLPFTIRRIFRIYPAYLTSLAIAIFLKAFLFRTNALSGLSVWFTSFWNWNLNDDLSMNAILKHALMIGPEFDAGQIDPIIWSLIVEMKISIIFPLIILIIKRINSLSGAVIAFSCSLAVPYLINIQFLQYLPLFVLGSILAAFQTELLDKAANIPVMLKVLILSIGVVFYTNGYCLQRFEIPDEIRNYFIGFGAALIIIFALSNSRFSSFLSNGAPKFLGKVSYSFYLLHFPVLLTCSSIIYSEFHSLAAAWAASLTVSLLLSYASYKWIEMPFQSLGRHISRMPVFNGFQYGKPSAHEHVIRKSEP